MVAAALAGTLGLGMAPGWAADDEAAAGAGSPYQSTVTGLQYQGPVQVEVVQQHLLQSGVPAGASGAYQVPQGPGPAPGPQAAPLGVTAQAPMVPGVLPTSVSPAGTVVVDPASLPPQTNLGGPPSTLGPYTLGPDDIVHIAVRNQPEFTGVYVIGHDGLIQYGIIGDIKADGLTKDELAEAIGDQLKLYVRFPSVTVTIIGFNSKAIYILGSVKSPGKYAMRGDTIKIRDALIAAGLEADHAALSRVEVIKPHPTDPTKRKLNLKRVMLKGETAENIDLVNGDVVVVPTTAWGKVTGALDAVFGPIVRVARWAFFF